MKKKIFKDIYSLEDIQKQRLRLGKKLKVTVNSLSDKTDVANILFKSDKREDHTETGEDIMLEMIEFLLPLGIDFISRHLQNNMDKKHFKRLVILFIAGNLSALWIYNSLNNKKKHRHSDIADG